jgi:putative endonuclease
MPFFVYILECSDKSLYTGATSDVEKRIHQHNTAKAGARYTKARRPVILRYKEKLKTFGASRTREAEIKRMTRTEKLLLIAKIKNK